ncbi:MAG: DUF1629 domain-containing protein [Bacteroidota bacterium]
MEIKDFYTLGSKLSSSTFQAHPVGLSSKEDNEGLFDEHKLIQGRYDSVSLPITFKQEQGNKLQDILDTGWSSLYLISERLKSVLDENGLTGWKTFPVKILDKKGGIVEGYHGFSITGVCGEISYDKCEIIEKSLVPSGPVSKYYKGLYVGLDKWDGSDFFLPSKNFGIIVTKNAMNAIKKEKLTNVAFKNLAEIETPEFALQTA